MSGMGYVLGQGLGRKAQGIKTFPRNEGQIGSKGLAYSARQAKSGFMECIVCDKVFSTDLSLHAHCISKKHIAKVRKHPNNLVLGCKPCAVKFQSQMMLKEHFKLVKHKLIGTGAYQRSAHLQKRGKKVGVGLWTKEAALAQ